MDIADAKRSQRGAGKSICFGLAWRPRDRILGFDAFIESLTSHKSVFVFTNAHVRVHVRVSAGVGEDEGEGGGATAEGQSVRQRQTATPTPLHALTIHR